MDGSIGPTPRRAPSVGGYARGQETRDRIIEAAFVVFAEEGYLGASTRRIAAVAGVNPPALQYYFDSKEGLNRACGQAIVDRTLPQLGPVLEHGRTALATGLREAMVEALCDLLECVADIAMSRVDGESESRFMNRCQADDSGPAFEVVQTQIGAPMKDLVTRLVAHIIGKAPDDHEARLRSMLVLSQVTLFHNHRDRTLQFVGWSDFDGENLDLVHRVLRENVRRLTTAP
jgi:AcrR family transcriptional regulator